jgi:catechol 2,3-dioxygenase-like lactoylglutathione lyase family enzyme
VDIRRAIPNLVTDHPAESRAFYADFLGFDVAMDEDGFTMFASPSNRTAQITVAARGRPSADAKIRDAQISVEVADVDAAHAEAVRRGLDVVYALTDEPWGIRRFFVRDPDGTVVNVNSHI